MKPRNSFHRRPFTDPLSWLLRPPEAGRPSNRLATALPVLALSAPAGVKPAVKKRVKANCPANAVSPRRLNCIARIVPPRFKVWDPFTMVVVLVKWKTLVPPWNGENPRSPKPTKFWMVIRVSDDVSGVPRFAPGIPSSRDLFDP